MKLFRWTIAAVLAVSAMSLCSVPSRADEWGSTGVRSGSETVGIYYSVVGQVVLNNTYYTNYSTTLSPTSSGGTTYNTFCVDLLHEATTTYTQLATPSPALTSSYSGGSATNPGTVSDSALGYAAWLANNYNSTATTRTSRQVFRSPSGRCCTRQIQVILKILARGHPVLGQCRRYQRCNNVRHGLGKRQQRCRFPCLFQCLPRELRIGRQW